MAVSRKLLVLQFRFMAQMKVDKLMNGVETLMAHEHEEETVNPSGEEFSPGNEGSPINTTPETQLAANKQRVCTDHGKQVTLSCNLQSAPVRHCQFEPPTGKPFSIDSDVTPEKAIQERYYFPPNKSLDRGDCAVSISNVEHEDVGQWTCGAQLCDGVEHLETIALQLQGHNTVPEDEEPAYLYGAIAAVVALIAILGLSLKQRPSFRPDSIIDDAHPQRPRRPIPIITIQSPTPSPPNSGRHISVPMLM